MTVVHAVLLLKRKQEERLREKTREFHRLDALRDPRKHYETGIRKGQMIELRRDIDLLDALIAVVEEHDPDAV